MIVLDLSILNQKGTPMFNSDIFANRPAFGIVGRIFISTDTAAIYRDTGSAWDLIADGGGVSTNIYNSDGTLTGNRTVASGGYYLLFNPQTTFNTTLTASVSESIYSVIGVNNLSYTAGFSSNNIGNVYVGNGGYNLQTFAGSATFAQANVASGIVSINSIDFSSAGSTITMTQSSGIRAMTGSQSMIQYQGTNSGTITHAAVHQNLGLYRPSAATGTLTISNAYSLLLNALDDYGAGFTFTTRWGIYQAGASDINYLAANLQIGSTSALLYDSKLQVTGDVYSTGVFRETITKHRNNASASLILAYNGKLIEMNVATANTLTIPIQSTSNLPVGAKIDVTQYGAGQTQIVAASGVTLQSAGSATKLRVQYSGATLIQADTNVWYLFGDITT